MNDMILDVSGPGRFGGEPLSGKRRRRHPPGVPGIRRLSWGVLLVFSACVAASGAQPDVPYSAGTLWDETTASLTFRESGHMPDTKEGFFWEVPSFVKRIVIAAGVRVTGGFRVRYRRPENPLWIVGENRDTSVIFGTEHEAWTDKNAVAENDKWRYSGISVVEDAVVHVSNLTVLNPRGYVISGYANKAVLHVDSCSLLDTRKGDNNNSDGFAGAAGSSVSNCLISTGDDGIKVYNDITIDTVTIIHHRNGAPLQFGWSQDSRDVTAVVRNLSIRGADPERRYNMAPLTWEQGRDGSRRITIDGLEVITSGEVYDEEKKAWKQIGLLEVKPRECEFNLDVTGARLHGLPLGTCHSKGRINIENAAAAKD